MPPRGRNWAEYVPSARDLFKLHPPSAVLDPPGLTLMSTP